MKIMKGDMTVLIGEKFTPGKAASYTVEGGVMGDEIVKTVCSEVAGLARAHGCWAAEGEDSSRYTEVSAKRRLQGGEHIRQGGVC